MKVRAGATAALAAGAAAETAMAPAYGASPSPSVSYTTLTIDDCLTAAMETMITVTNAETVYYCPTCQMGTSAALVKPSATGTGYVVIYTTEFVSLCPTGVATATYTVTESCTDETPTWTPGPSHIPNGFTVTEKECTVCGKETPTLTITEPCGCEATSGKVVSAKPTPLQQISDGQVQNPKIPLQQISDGQVQNPAATPGKGGAPASLGPSATMAACNGKDCGGAANQNPAYTPSSPGSGGSPAAPYPTTTAQCPGPECRAKATAGGNTTSIALSPYAGSAASGRASTSQVGFIVSMALSIIVGGLAFGL